MPINSFPEKKTVELSKFKEVAEDKLNVAIMTRIDGL